MSTKTLARAFVRGTGSTFRDWRVHARLHAATRHLADGAAVQDAAARVGYTSVSSFIGAFRRRFGVTPARYAADVRHGHSAPAQAAPVQAAKSRNSPAQV